MEDYTGKGFGNLCGVWTGVRHPHNRDNRRPAGGWHRGSDHHAGRDSNGDSHGKGRGCEEMKAKEILQDIGWCVVSAIPIFLYAMFFYVIG